MTIITNNYFTESKKMKAKVTKESALRYAQNKFNGILKKEIPISVMLGYNKAHRELYLEFIKPFVDPETGEINGKNFNLSDIDAWNTSINNLVAKLTAEYNRTKAQYDEAEAEIIENTYIPTENIEILKNVMGDKFNDYFKEIEPEDKDETAKTE